MFTFLRRLFAPAVRRGHLLSDAKFERLQQTLHYRVRNRAQFEEALVHRSYVQLLGSRKHNSNERLEFLGDSVLGLVVAEHLFRQSKASEGELTKFRSRLVNRKALAEYAGHLHLTEYVLVSPSAQQSIVRGSDALLADAYEAIIGAIYLDGGYDAARAFIHDFIIANPVARELLHTDENFKSRLLEYSQGHSYGLPRYVVVNEQGPDHERVFTVQVFLRNTQAGEGRGRSKREAEQAAARDAMMKVEERRESGAQ